MFISLVKMCIVEMYLVFLIFVLNWKEDKEWRGEYYSGIFGGNIKRESEFIVISLFSCVVYGPAFPVHL